MSELTIYYTEVCQSGSWQREDAERCGCKGSGWWLSELDTWHKCSVHGKANDRHPEEGPDYVTETCPFCSHDRMVTWGGNDLTCDECGARRITEQGDTP